MNRQLNQSLEQYVSLDDLVELGWLTMLILEPKNFLFLIDGGGDGTLRRLIVIGRVFVATHSLPEDFEAVSSAVGRHSSNAGYFARNQSFEEDALAGDIKPSELTWYRAAANTDETTSNVWDATNAFVAAIRHANDGNLESCRRNILSVIEAAIVADASQQHRLMLLSNTLLAARHSILNSMN